MAHQIPALERFLDQSFPKLGLDIDGCMDEMPQFFQFLSHVWPGQVVVVTARADEQEASEYVAELGIRFDELFATGSLAAKPAVVIEQQIEIFLDDQPEALKGMPDSVRTLLVRNDGNYDFDDHRWMLSDKTGKLL